jgi:undecaprenyl-diphosphatase
MNYFQAILLGLLQGITEFLPVSSTAHMAIVPQLLGMQDPGAAFSAIAQLGPIVAIVSYFRNDLSKYFHGILRTKSPKKIPAGDLDAKLGWFTLLGTLPLIVFAIALEKKVDTTFRSLYITAFSLIALALVLIVAEQIGKKNKSLDTLTLKQSQQIGWAQVLALVPGASRSGVTITAGLFTGLDRESAARFSFLLSIPAITLAGLYKLSKFLIHPAALKTQAGPALVAALAAGLIAYAVVNWFLGFMKEHTTKAFIIYRIALGVLVLVLLQTHYLTPKKPIEINDAEGATTAQTQ